MKVIVVESDSSMLIEMLKGCKVNDAKFDGLIHDIQQLARQLESVVFMFAPRQHNRAAHLVTFFVITNIGSCRWSMKILE